MEGESYRSGVSPRCTGRARTPTLWASCWSDCSAACCIAGVGAARPGRANGDSAGQRTPQHIEPLRLGAPGRAERTTPGGDRTRRAGAHASGCPASPAPVTFSLPPVTPRATAVWVRRCQRQRQRGRLSGVDAHTRLTVDEVLTIETMEMSPEYRHISTGRLAILAERRGRVFAAPATWYTPIGAAAGATAPSTTSDRLRAATPDTAEWRQSRLGLRVRL